MGEARHTKSAIAGTANKCCPIGQKQEQSEQQAISACDGEARIRFACAEIAQYAGSRNVTRLNQRGPTNEMRLNCEIEEHHSTVQLHRMATKGE